MHRLLKIINDFKNYFVFVALVIISLSLISTTSSSAIGGFRTVVITFIGYLQETFFWIPNPGSLMSENKVLTELNLQLSTEVATMRQAQQENEELRAMLELEDKSEHNVIAADVVQKSSVQMRNYVIINKGTDDKVKVGMTARSSAGLLGNIIGTSNTYSIIELINNRNIKIPARLVDSQHEGLVVWEGGENLLLKNISKAYEIKKGELVTTSMFSVKYPHNIPIGTVEKVEDEPGTHFSRITIKPASKFFNSKNVFVINVEPDRQIQSLISEIEDKIKFLDKKSK